MRRAWFCLIFVAGLLYFDVLAGNTAFAAEKASNWRNTYDTIFRWINFGILVFLFFKFIKNPLMDFLHSRKEELAGHIKHLEEERGKAASNVQETNKRLEESITRLAEIKEKIVKQGEKQKQKIIQSAHDESMLLMDGAGQKAKNIIKQGRNRLRNELIDFAFDSAIKKIPAEITDADNRKFIDIYFSSTRFQ